MATPKELGGSGGAGTNPEQLFAAGYSACFLGALKVAGRQLKLNLPVDASVTATVGIGSQLAGGFGIEVDLVVALPGIKSDDATTMLEAAHQICPYSNATRNNIEVRSAVAPDHALESALIPVDGEGRAISTRIVFTKTYLLVGITTASRRISCEP